MYQNFSEAIKDRLKDCESILEIGPGTNITPTISIIQNTSIKLYVAVDAALNMKEASNKFSQIGGLVDYSGF